MSTEYRYSYLDSLLKKLNLKETLGLDSVLFILRGGCLFGYTQFYNNDTASGGTIFGYTGFYANQPVSGDIQGAAEIYGYTNFYAHVEPRLLDSVFGYTYFYGDFFPPEGVTSSYSFTRVRLFDTSIVTFGSKVEQAVSNEDSFRRGYRLNFKGLTKEEVNLILSFFKEHQGRKKYFYLRNPITGLADTMVRFNIDQLDLEVFERDLYNTNEITLLEL